MVFDIKKGTPYIVLFLFIFLPAIWAKASATNYPSLVDKFSPQDAHYYFQVGGFNARQGKAQNIGVNGLIGDRFTLTNGNDRNGLLGVGYYVDGLICRRYKLLFGLNVFYLAETVVKGTIIQEQLFENLSYKYSITNYPLYLAAKAMMAMNNLYDLTFDVGIGANYIKTNSYSETSIDALPDNSFVGNSKIDFSATAGVGIKINRIFGSLPLEIGYRFFYLGKGNLSKANNQIQNNLTTGNSYANALIFTISA